MKYDKIIKYCWKCGKERETKRYDTPFGTSYECCECGSKSK